MTIRDTFRAYQISRIHDPVERYATALQAFGKSGIEKVERVRYGFLPSDVNVVQIAVGAFVVGVYVGALIMAVALRGR